MHMVTIIVRYIVGKKNVLVVQLSYPDEVFPTEWSLLLWVFDSVFEVCGCPDIDLFAMRANASFRCMCLRFQIPWCGN